MAALEMAIILSALLLMVFGTLQFGRALAARNDMSHALGQAMRVVHLDPTTTPDDVIAFLEGELGNYGSGDLDVTISEVSGTSFMEIAVSFPFEITIPFTSISEVTLQVRTLAPIVSATTL